MTVAMWVLLILLLEHDSLKLIFRELLVLSALLCGWLVSLASGTRGVDRCCLLEKIRLLDLLLDLTEISLANILSFGSLPNSGTFASLLLARTRWWLQMLHGWLLKPLCIDTACLSLLAACILPWTWFYWLWTDIRVSLDVTFLTMFHIDSCYAMRPLQLLLVSDGNVLKIYLPWVICFISTRWNHWMSLWCIHWNWLLARNLLMRWATLSLLLIHMTKPQSFRDSHGYAERVEVRMKISLAYFKPFWLLFFNVLKHAKGKLSFNFFATAWIESCIETNDWSVLHECQFDDEFEPVLTDLVTWDVDNFKVLIEAECFLQVLCKSITQSIPHKNQFSKSSCIKDALLLIINNVSLLFQYNILSIHVWII